MSTFEVAKTDRNKVRKDIAVEFLHLVSLNRPKEGLKFFASDCKTHNPYVVGGMNELIEAMIAVQKQGSQGIIKGSTADFRLAIKQVLAEGDTVAVYTTVSSPDPAQGGLRQVHLFRFNQDDKVAEYWDITQMVAENMPNATAAFT